MVTSRSCSGTCFTLSIPRHPKVRAADNPLGLGGREVEEIALRTAAASAAGVVGASVGGLALMLHLLGWMGLVGRNLFGRMAREGKKDLVQAGLAEREVANPHTGP